MLDHSKGHIHNHSMETVFFIVGRMLTAIFSPVCLFMAILLVLAFRVPRSMERPRLRGAFLGLWCAALLFSLPVVSNTLISWWETPRTLAPTGHWDAILVLGGSVDAANSAQWQIELNDSAERIVSAARLWNEGRAPRVYVSGGSGDPHFPDAREAPLIKQLLIGMGVADVAILVEPDSRSTFENAANMRNRLIGSGVKSLVLITSALHMPRARAIFEKAGFGNAGSTGIAMDVLSVDTLQSPLVFPESFIPNAGAIVGTSRVIKEMVGFVLYRIIGRL